jgi:hypothetical protein
LVSFSKDPARLATLFPGNIDHFAISMRPKE